MKSVLISIQPKWCELIANGKKTVEVRKTKPKLDTPFKVYIYMTKAYDTLFGYGKPKKLCVDGGKVIGEFMCKAILPISITYSDPNSRVALKEFPFTCLTDKEIMDYLGNGKTGYGWHISDLVIYDTPKEIWEFATICKELIPHKCMNCVFFLTENNESTGFHYECVTDCLKPLERPPQSWCYVERLG